MMKRVVADSIINMGEYSSRYMKGIFSFVGFETKWIKYEDAERVKGTSKDVYKRQAEGCAGNGEYHSYADP